MDVWTSVEDGYEVPKTVDKDGVVVNKPLAKWTKREKEMSSYNAKFYVVFLHPSKISSSI